MSSAFFRALMARLKEAGKQAPDLLKGSTSYQDLKDAAEKIRKLINGKQEDEEVGKERMEDILEHVYRQDIGVKSRVPSLNELMELAQLIAQGEEEELIPPFSGTHIQGDEEYIQLLSDGDEEETLPPPGLHNAHSRVLPQEELVALGVAQSTGYCLQFESDKSNWHWVVLVVGAIAVVGIVGGIWWLRRRGGRRGGEGHAGVLGEEGRPGDETEVAVAAAADPAPQPSTPAGLQMVLHRYAKPDHAPIAIRGVKRLEEPAASGFPTVGDPDLAPPSMGIFVEERAMQGPSQLNPDASPFIPISMSSFADKAPEKQAESSSKGDISGSILDPLQYEENDMDSVAVAKSVCSMFPNVSTDFIDELLKANGFDIHLMIDTLHDLNSQDMFHDDAELGFPTFADTTDLLEGQGLAGGDKHCAEVSGSSSILNPALQNEKPATTSDVKSGLSASPKTNPLHNDLGLADGTKSEGTSVAN